MNCYWRFPVSVEPNKIASLLTFLPISDCQRALITYLPLLQKLFLPTGLKQSRVNKREHKLRCSPVTWPKLGSITTSYLGERYERMENRLIGVDSFDREGRWGVACFSPTQKIAYVGMGELWMLGNLRLQDVKRNTDIFFYYLATRRSSDQKQCPSLFCITIKAKWTMFAKYEMTHEGVLY